jgi:S1-C subfamily serine protease
LILVAAPLFAVRPVSRSLAGPLAARAADRLGSLASLFFSPAERPAAPLPQPASDPVAAEPFAAGPDRSRPSPRSRSRKKARRFHVPRAAVMRAMAQSSHPTARIVAEADDHPAGIAIISAGSLDGLLFAGDVITEVSGVPASSEQAVLAVVARAQQAGAKIVSGRVWRRGEYWTATAETPWSCDGCAEPSRQHP